MQQTFPLWKFSTGNFFFRSLKRLNFLLSFLLNIRQRGFYSVFKFSDIFYTWFLLILNFSR